VNPVKLVHLQPLTNI